MHKPLLLTLTLASCAPDDPTRAPIRDTPPGGKVNLSGVTLTLANASLQKNKQGIHTLSFDYTLDNTSGHQIQFPCLYSNTDPMLQLSITDKDNNPIPTGNRPLDQLTLTEPKQHRILPGKTTRNYSVPIPATTLKPTDPLTLQARFHVPSRYDELRTTLTAPPLKLTWPGKPQPTPTKPTPPTNSTLQLPTHKPNSARQ